MWRDQLHLEDQGRGNTPKPSGTLLLLLLLFSGADCDTDHYLLVAKVRERLAVRKQAAQKSDGVRFNLRKQNDLEVR